MKKVIAILVIFLCAGAALSAQVQMSVGVGGSFTSAFGGGGEMTVSGLSAGFEFPYSGGGFHAFFDATYFEASIGLFFGTLNMEGTGLVSGTSGKIMDFDGLTLGLLGKFPIDLGFLTLFPAVGIEYLLISNGKDDNGNSLSDPDEFNHLWIKFGVGADFSITEQIFIRGTILYGIRLESSLESDINKIYSFDPVLGHGIQVKLAVGFKL